MLLLSVSFGAGIWSQRLIVSVLSRIVVYICVCFEAVKS